MQVRLAAPNLLAKHFTVVLVFAEMDIVAARGVKKFAEAAYFVGEIIIGREPDQADNSEFLE